MRYLSALGIICSIVAIIASMGMNYAFMAGQGKTVFEGQILGGISVAFDGLKSCLPIFIAAAIATSQYFKAFIGSTLFILLICFALVSALGFAAGNRGAVTGGREAITQKYELAHKELEDAQERFAQIKTKRAPGTIASDMSAMKQERRWKSTKGCVGDHTTAKLSIAFCKQFFALKAEHENALEAVKLRKALSTLRTKVAKLKAQGAGKPADPQAGIIAKFIPGFEIADVQTALNVFIAVLVEMVAAFGLYLSTGHSMVRKVKQKLEAKEHEAEPEFKPAAVQSKAIVKKEEQGSPKSVVLPFPGPGEIATPERFNLNKAQALISST
ncbi:MAG: hypothetical protein AAF228_06095 [Pseudomonadota bacterium]